MPWLLLALAAAGIFLAITFGRHVGETDGGDPRAIGKSLPFLHLEPLTGGGQTVSLADLPGKVTLVNYWGTWCPPCRREFPHIVELGQTFAGRDDFRLYAVSTDGEKDEDVAALEQATAEFLKARGAELPTYVDRDAASRRAMVVALGLEDFGYPATLVLDRQARIRGLWIGFASPDALRALVESLLEEPTRPAESSRESS